MQAQTQAELLEHFVRVMQKFDTAMLITHSHADALHARPMAVAEVSADGTLWFITNVKSPKVEELKENPEAFVTAQTSSEFAALTGHLVELKDPRKVEQIWKESYRVWFSGGKDDPELVLLRFTPRDVEYWDNSGTRGVKYALRALSAYVRGDELGPGSDDPNAHARLRL